MEVSRDGVRLPLPQSKKTRALLAYLAVTGRPHRRDRLCSLLWEMPDDPRGSLRWSLSKLRPLVDEPARRRILAEGEMVSFDAEGAAIDVLTLARRCGDDPAEVETADLEAAAAAFRGDFLEGIELGRCPDFQAWCVAERERARQLHRRVLETLVARLADDPPRALVHARRLVQTDPLDEEARAALIRLVGRAGHREEAARHYDDGLRLLHEAGIRSSGLLKTAWHEVKASRPVATHAAPHPAESPSLPVQRVEYCTTGDGVRIAYSAVGEGPPIVKAANWLNHLEFDWESPVWRHWLHELTSGHRLIRYDERGNGLSDWDVAELSVDAFVRDLEAVVDAAGLDRFTLLGISQGCAVSIAYAARHPERVERMILYGGYALGWRARGQAEVISAREAMLTLLRQGWGQEHPAFRQLFTAHYIPGGTPEEMQWWNDLQRVSASPENAARLFDTLGDIDVSALLDKVRVPTLVVHCRDDAGVPYAQGEVLAKRIPGARFVTLASRNHVVLEHEPAWPHLVAELRSFLGNGHPGAMRPAAPAHVPEPPEPAAVPMIGREAERARLDAALGDAARQQRERIVLLTGDPGLGKTRLLAELAAATRAAGGTVLDGCAYEVESGRPFGPWIDALRRLHPAGAGEIKGAEPGAELAPLLPELAAADDGEPSRDRLFGAVAELIAARVQAAPPVLLAFDDAQWLDDESAALLHYVARFSRSQPVLIVLAGRAGEFAENESMARVLRALRREAPVDEITLAPLSPVDTARLASAAVPGVDAARVYAESAGNPLLALEVARALPHAKGDLPQGLAELVRDRVARLPEAAAEVLRWAALLGPEFTQDRLGAVAGIAPEALVAALEVLQRHALVRHDEAVRRAAATYVFVHDVVRRAIRADISAARRRLMHGRIAAVLAAAGDADGEAAADLVTHAVEAGETALAARACVAAGRRCLRLFANAEAAALARRGMTLAATLADPEQVKLMLELMEVSLAADRPKVFDDTAALLDDLASRALDHGCLEHARLGYQLMGFLRWEGGNWTDARRQMLQAELVSRSTDARGRVLGMSEAARCLALLERDLPEAEAMLLEAEAIAARAGIEPVAISDGRGILRLHQGKLDEAAALFERARLIARRDGERRAEFMALEHLIAVELQRADYAKAGGLCRELMALGEKLREGSEAPFAQALCALSRYATGERSARDTFDLAVGALREVDAKQRLAFVLVQAAMVELGRGDPDAAAPLAREAVTAAGALGRPSDVALAHAMAARVAIAALDDIDLAFHLEALRRVKVETLSVQARDAVTALLAEQGGNEAPKRSGRVRSGVHRR
jgi:predicted ATPase/DNA-binding SARP family transcriptional activator/pimeloyl-ACP methyl ester carboxylesterase